MICHFFFLLSWFPQATRIGSLLSGQGKCLHDLHFFFSPFDSVYFGELFRCKSYTSPPLSTAITAAIEAIWAILFFIPIVVVFKRYAIQIGSLLKKVLGAGTKLVCHSRLTISISPGRNMLSALEMSLSEKQ